MARKQRSPAPKEHGAALTDNETRRLLKLKSDTRYSLPEILDAIDEVIELRLSPAELLTTAARGERHWKTHCETEGEVDRRFEAVSRLLRRVGTPRQNKAALLKGELPSFDSGFVLDSPSCRRELWFLCNFYRLGHRGEVERALRAFIDGIVGQHAVGDPGKGLSAVLSDIALHLEHRRLHASIRAAGKSVSRRVTDEATIRSQLDPATSPGGQPWDPPDPLGDLARILSRNRRRTNPLSPKALAGVWLQERMRLRGDDRATGPVTITSTERLLKRLEASRRRFSRGSRRDSGDGIRLIT